MWRINYSLKYLFKRTNIHLTGIKVRVNNNNYKKRYVSSDKMGSPVTDKMKI
jgi:hypothetical protein